MKKALHTIYGLAMIFLFIAICGFAEGEKFSIAFILAIVESVLALFYGKLFPAEDKKEDRV